MRRALPFLPLLLVAGCSGSSSSRSTATSPPEAEFSGAPPSGAAPLTVSFTDLSTGSVTSWSWDFGDGGVSSDQDPDHDYAAPGDYTVSLTVMGPGGSDTETKTDYVTVAPPPPAADFSGAPSSGLAPLPVDFADLSTGDVTSWSWDFGDGGSSSDPSPSHTFVGAGTYTVSLTVTGPGGADTMTKTDTVRATILDASDALSYEATGTMDVLLVPASLQDASAPVSQARLIAIQNVVAQAVAANSGGALAVQFQRVWPPVAIPKTMGDYSPETGLVAIRRDALAGARARGFEPDDFDREVVFAPDVWPGTGRGWMRTIWMPHDLEWVLLHELGHTLNWAHANLWDGDPTKPGQAGEGVAVNYGDLFDPMGTQQMWNRFRRFGPSYQLRAGWITDEDVVDVARDGTWTLAGLGEGGGAPKALRVRQDAGHDLWIFHREEEPLVDDGAMIVRTPMNPFESLLLLDMMPQSAASLQDEVADAALVMGQSFFDPGSGVTITNVSPDPTAVVIQVDVDEALLAGLDRLPVVRFAGPPIDGNPVSGIVDFDVEVHDPDAGDADGAGIAMVTMELLRSDDDSFPSVAEMEFPFPPYSWSFDTADLEVSNYYLSVTAEAVDGGLRTAWARYLVEAAPGDGE